MKRILLGLSSVVLFACVMLSGPAVDAGQSYGMSFNCYKSGTTGICYGSLRAARLSSGSADFAEFTYYSTGTLFFAASYGGTAYSCSFPATESARLGPAAIASDYNVYFYITMSGSTCQGASLNNSSEYQSLPKP